MILKMTKSHYEITKNVTKNLNVLKYKNKT